MAPSAAAARLLARMQQLPDISLYQPRIEEDELNAKRQQISNVRAQIASLRAEEEKRTACLETYQQFDDLLQMLIRSDTANEELRASIERERKDAVDAAYGSHEDMLNELDRESALRLDELGRAYALQSDELQRESSLRHGLEEEVSQLSRAIKSCTEERDAERRKRDAESVDYIDEVEAHKITKRLLAASNESNFRLHIKSVSERRKSKARFRRLHDAFEQDRRSTIGSPEQLRLVSDQKGIFTDDLDRATPDIATLMAQLEVNTNFNSDYTNSNDQKYTLGIDVKELSAEIATQQSSISQLEKSKAELHDDITALNSQNFDVGSECVELSEKCETQRAYISQLEDEKIEAVEGTRRKRGKAKDRIFQLEEQLCTSRVRMNELKAEGDGLTNQLLHAGEVNAQVEAENVSLHGKVQGLEGCLIEADEVNTMLENQVKDLSHQLDNLQSTSSESLDHARNEIETLKSEQQTNEASISCLTKSRSDIIVFLYERFDMEIDLDSINEDFRAGYEGLPIATSNRVVLLRALGEHLDWVAAETVKRLHGMCEAYEEYVGKLKLRIEALETDNNVLIKRILTLNDEQETFLKAADEAVSSLVTKGQILRDRLVQAETDLVEQMVRNRDLTGQLQQSEVTIKDLEKFRAVAEPCIDDLRKKVNTAVEAYDTLKPGFMPGGSP